MQRAVIVMLIGIGATVSGCGPTELQRRTCDMYVDAGGRAAPDLAYWIKFFNAPNAVDDMNKRYAEREGPKPPETSQVRAQRHVASVKLANQMAKDIVSARLSISLREVDQALEKCLSSTLRAKIK
jgi:hypothetical protein